MKKKVVNSQLCNWSTYQMYKRQMLTLAENVFEFKNLPEIIDVGYMNQVLITKGSIAFFYDDMLESVVALPYSILGELDIYGRPQTIMVHSANGRYYRKLNKGEFVIMYDNNGYYPIYLDILQLSERIALCVRTNDINIVQQRTPRIWKTSEDKKMSVQNVINEIDAMCERVVTYDSLDIEDMSVVESPAPFVADKIDDHLEKLWAEFYRLIGIANLQEQKKERVIVDEMRASQGGTIASRWSRYQPREYAINLINKKWNQNIKVSYYDGDPSMDPEVKDSEVEEDVFISDVSNVTS